MLVLDKATKYTVVFSATGIGTVTVLKDADPAVVTGGYGGWQVVQRPKRRGLTQWMGRDPIRMEVPVLFDGFAKQDSQEVEISKLSRMALPHGDEPPVVDVDGHGIPNPGPEHWVIEDLTWGKNVEWEFSSDGVMSRLRQDCVVKLLEYVDETRTAFSRLVNNQPGAGIWPKHYTFKKGDTLAKIASKFYKNSKKWKKIADANGIRDPKSIKPGRVLVIPKP
jgi:LysM domain